MKDRQDEGLRQRMTSAKAQGCDKLLGAGNRGLFGGDTKPEGCEMRLQRLPRCTQVRRSLGHEEETM